MSVSAINGAVKDELTVGGGTSAVPAARPRVRVNVAWTSAGMAVFSASSWLMVSVIAKLGSVELLGQYALALAVSLPVLTFAQLNLRAVLATDASGQFPFSAYLHLRRLMMAVAVLGVVVYALATAANLGSARIIALAACAQAVEWISDIYQGLMQRRERMDRVAISMAARGVLSLGALALGMWLTGDLAVGLALVIAARAALLLAYDSTFGIAGLDAGETSRPPAAGLIWKLLLTALPLGAVVGVVSLVTNTPRYFISHHLGNHELGIFSALASLIQAGSLFVNAIGQTVTPRLASYFAARDHRNFRLLTAKMMLAGLLLCAAAVIGSALLGRQVLTIAYKPEYANRVDLLVPVMAAGGIGYLASLLGYAITAARRFREQIPLHLAVLAASAGVAAVFVPRFGVIGAIYGMAAGFAVQIAGELFILLMPWPGEESTGRPTHG